ncbi:hypothetical protein EGJ54_25385, partial [Pandoraea apista]|uniref:hypothetical protein n=1 Tax=Pandoraea apista TaxID=93218 RepID=UPI000FA713B1
VTQAHRSGLDVAQKKALDGAFDAAIAKAKASHDDGLKAALEASRRDHTYKTAGELEAALSSYAASKRDVADAQAVASQVTKLNDALEKVPGLSTRLKKFVRPGSAQEKLVALTKDLPVQIEVQKFINELPHDSEADRALVARMNAKAYASEQAARDDLVVQRALRDAITRARLNKDEALAKALMTDEYRTTADIESAVRVYEQSQMVAKELDAQGLKIADIDARLSRTPGLATRLERLYERGGRNLARVEAAVDEQQKIQTLINELPKAGDAGRAIISRMNARDYASVQEARADLLAQQGGQMVDAEIVKAQVAGNVELAETLKKALAGGVALTPTQAQALLVKVNRAQADMALERAIMQANQAGNIELLKSLMTARGSEMFKTKEQVDVAVREIEQALARAGLTWKAHETVGSMEANAKWSERDESNGEPYKRTPRNPWVNEDRMLVDMYGRVVPVPYLKTESGHYVYRRADGSLTTDIHGGAMPEGEVIVDERERKKRAARAFTPEVNERP